MPKLPDPYGERATPRNNARMLNYGQADQSGVAVIGEVVSGIGRGIREREQALSLSRAKTNFMLGQAKLLSDIENDEDYLKHEDVYAEGSKKLREEAIKDLSPNAQEALSIELDMIDGRGQVAVQESALRKQKMKGVADLEQGNYDLIEAFKSLPSGPVASKILETAGQNIDEAVSNGLIDAVEGGRLKRETGRRAVIAKAEMIEDPGARMAYLMGAEGQLVPVEERMKLIESAKEHGVMQSARNLADAAIAKHGDDKAAVDAEIANIKDVEVRRNAQYFADGDHSRRKSAQAEVQANNFNSMADQILTAEDPQSVFEKLPMSGGWSTLSPANKLSLQKLAKGDEVQNNNLLFDHIMKTAETDRKAALDLLNNNAGSFSASTFQTLRNKLSTDVEAKDALTVIQRIKNVTGEDKPAGEVYLQYEQRLLEEQALGKPVTQERKNQIIENLIVESANWGTDKTYEMSDNNKRDAQFETLDMLRERIIRKTGVTPDKEALGAALEKYEDELTEIRKEFKLRGVKNPTDEMVRAKWKAIRG